MRRPGKEVWRFYTAAASNEPGGETWAGAPDETRAASHVGTARRLRSVASADLLGRREPDAQHARQSPRRQLERDSDRVAGRSLQQLDDRARSRYRQAEVVLPAPAGRRLGRGLHPRAHAAAHDGRSRSEVREVDQPGRQARRAARRRGDGRRGRRHLRARSRDRPVPLGDSVSVRHAGLPDLEHRRQDRAACTSTRTSSFTGPSDRQRDLLLEHAQLLADGVSSGHQRAVRSVRRELSGHDERRTRTASRANSAAAFRARDPIPTRGPG